jgi:ABC-type transport system involved in multi-copper enzyme maturation permease subunit
MRAIIQIALNTFRETIRGKLTPLLLAFGIVVVGFSAAFGSVTLGDQVKVLIDFGLFSISIFSVGMAVIAGASLMHKEIQLKTAYNILAKSVSRWQLVIGKYLGLLFSVTLMNFFMASMLCSVLYAMEGDPHFLILEAAFFIFFELAIITAVSIFFSAILVTPTLVGLFSFAIFIIGRSVDYLPKMIAESSNNGLNPIIDSVYWIMPHLNQLSVSNLVPYNLGASADQFLSGLAYSFSYASATLIIACLVFSRKNFT